MIFNRLYNSGSSLEGGTLFQLRNLINRTNIKQDISGRFNEAIDFFELVVTANIVAACLHYFGMKSVDEMPTKNLPSMPSRPQLDLWPVLVKSAGAIVDRYVVVHETCQQIATKYHKTSAARSVTQTEVGMNPHAACVASEHCYYSDPTSQTCRKRKRRLPQWLRSHEQTPAISTALVQIAPDGIFN